MKSPAALKDERSDGILVSTSASVQCAKENPGLRKYLFVYTVT